MKKEGLDGKITSVYRKPTFSGVFTHYESYVDQKYKKSLNDILLFHCFSICFDYMSFHLEVENLEETLKRIVIHQELQSNP